MKILILISIFCSSLLAKDVYVFLSTSPNEDLNYKTYYNEVRRGYEVAKNNGDEAFILTTSGSWNLSTKRNTKLSNFSLTERAQKPMNQNKHYTSNPAYPDVDASFTRENFKKIIAQAKEKVSGDGKVVFVINGHGELDSSSDTELFLDGGQTVTLKELSKDIKDVPNTKQIVTNICYGGDVHDVSQELPNTCSTSAVPAFTKSSSGVEEESFYLKKYFENLQAKNSSLLENSINVFESDIANVGLGTLSSFDYIDRVLEEGVYAYKGNELKSQVNDSSDVLREYNKSVVYFEKPQNLDMSASISPLANYSCVHCLSDLNSAVNLDLSELVSLVNSYNDVQLSKYTKKLIEYQNFLKDNRHKMQKEIRKLQSSESELEKDEEEFQSKFSNASGIYKYLFGYEDKKKELIKRRQLFNSRKENTLQSIYTQINHLKAYEKLERFLKTASANEKAKFMGLLKCELI